MAQRASLLARIAQHAGLTPSRLQEAMQPAAHLTRRAPSWVFLGPPGVGKGTYACRVADALGIAHISAGDLVRQEMKQQTELGRKVRLLFRAICSRAGAVASAREGWHNAA